MVGVIALNVFAGALIIAMIASGVPLAVGVLLSILLGGLIWLNVELWRLCATVDRIGRGGKR